MAAARLPHVRRDAAVTGRDEAARPFPAGGGQPRGLAPCRLLSCLGCDSPPGTVVCQPRDRPFRRRSLFKKPPTFL